ncbi:phytase [Caulobacter sp. DWP3-1-3b2]|uniref:phytase n=1 Tax=Caulobacter sp. DWP3-1-3b2 TaxID=2804643 RepID=UPI003CFADEDD
MRHGSSLSLLRRSRGRFRPGNQATQSEGWVADDRTGQLYVAEEDVGVWRFPAAPEIQPEPLVGFTWAQPFAGETEYLDADSI